MFLGAQVPACSNLRRPEGQGGCACALIRHAFAYSVLDSRLSQETRLCPPSRCLVDPMAGKRKRSWTADALCCLGADCVLVGVNEQEIDSPWASIPNSDEPTEDATPFLPRFLLQEMIFTHSPYDDLYPYQSRLQVNHLCRADWLCLRGIAELQGAPHSARVLAGTGASEQILLAASGKSAPQSARKEERRIRRRRCVIPATVPTSGAHLCSLSVPASPTHSWEFPHQIRLALSLSRESQTPSASSCRSRSQPTSDRWVVANESSLCRGKHQLSVRHRGTHLGQHSTDIFHARSVLAQETAATVLLYRGQPNRGKWTHRSGVVEPCGRKA